MKDFASGDLPPVNWADFLLAIRTSLSQALDQKLSSDTEVERAAELDEMAFVVSHYLYQRLRSVISPIQSPGNSGAVNFQVIGNEESVIRAQVTLRSTFRETQFEIMISRDESHLPEVRETFTSRKSL